MEQYYCESTDKDFFLRMYVIYSCVDVLRIHDI